MSAPLTDPAALNAICPYFTMFPLDFPLTILRRRARSGDCVLDPFCGRGTTNFAARLRGLSNVGVDSSPVAAAIAAAKLVFATPQAICEAARSILAFSHARQIPVGDFWTWAYHPQVLRQLCQLREALLENCASPERVALRAILLGALHGPKQKSFPSYLSNQSPRTYAPKPAYATNFWHQRGLRPDDVDVIALIERRALRYYGEHAKAEGVIRQADSRDVDALSPMEDGRPFDWVITSPPYYGMRTYIPDQWLRNWFVGGPETVDYSSRDQVTHASPEQFAGDLSRVWRNASASSKRGAKLVIRFGGITDRDVEPLKLVKDSLADTGWHVLTAKRAGSAREGKRQADSFLRARTKPVAEYDVWAVNE